MCFDTTAVNTGHRNGTCVSLEQKLGRNLLHFACRHYVMEIILAAAFQSTLGGNSGPDVLLFKQFQAQWASFDLTSFEPGVAKSNVIENIPDNVREQTLIFETDQLQKVQPRDNYAKLLKLSILFLGNVPPQEVKFRNLGPVHHAR